MPQVLAAPAPATVGVSVGWHSATPPGRSFRSAANSCFVALRAPCSSHSTMSSGGWCSAGLQAAPVHALVGPLIRFNAPACRECVGARICLSHWTVPVLPLNLLCRCPCLQMCLWAAGCWPCRCATWMTGAFAPSSASRIPWQSGGTLHSALACAIQRWTFCASMICRSAALPPWLGM